MGTTMMRTVLIMWRTEMHPRPSYSPSLREKLLKGKLHHSPVGTARILVVTHLEVRTLKTSP